MFHVKHLRAMFAVKRLAIMLMLTVSQMFPKISDDVTGWENHKLEVVSDVTTMIGLVYHLRRYGRRPHEKHRDWSADSYRPFECGRYREGCSVAGKPLAFSDANWAELLGLFGDQVVDSAGFRVGIDNWAQGYSAIRWNLLSVRCAYLHQLWTYVAVQRDCDRPTSLEVGGVSSWTNRQTSPTNRRLPSPVEPNRVS